eukprot:35931_1
MIRGIPTKTRFILFLPFLARGSDHNCATQNDKAKCWGYNVAGQLGYEDVTNRGDEANQMGDSLFDIDLGSDFTPMKIVTGYAHSCALSTTNKVKCFGGNGLGQLGYGDTNNRGISSNQMGDSLLDIELGSNFTPMQIVAGYYHTCALSTTNKVKCFGANGRGQLGYGDADHRGDEANEMADKLLEVDLGSSFIPIQIVAGYTHTCALSISNAKCWGYNSRGQLGYDDGIDRGDGTNEMGDNLPNIALGSSFTPTQIVAAFYHTCALSTDNKVKCWGENFYGQLGYEDQVDRGDLMGSNEMGDSLPNIDLGSGFTPTQIMVGEYHTCALSSSNKVKCWGKNNYGQLGYGDMNDRGDGPDEMGNNLLDVDLGSSFIPIQIMGGSYHTCALSMNHKIKCWGRNNFGQLGYEDVQNRGDGSNEMG